MSKTQFLLMDSRALCLGIPSVPFEWCCRRYIFLESSWIVRVTLFPFATRHSTTPNDTLRASRLSEFNTNERCRVLVVSITAGGQGLDFTAASNVVFVELPESPAWLRQAEDRLHRRRQVCLPCLHVHMFFGNSVPSAPVARVCVAPPKLGWMRSLSCVCRQR